MNEDEKNLCLVFLIAHSPVVHPSSQRQTSLSLFWLHKNKGEENVKLPQRSSLGLKKKKKRKEKRISG